MSEFDITTIPSEDLCEAGRQALRDIHTELERRGYTGA